MKKTGNWKRICRLMKMLYSQNRGTLPMKALLGVFGALLPLAPLVLSANILSGLEHGRPAQELIPTALFGVGIIFLIYLVYYLILRFERVNSYVAWAAFNFANARKSLSLDYQDIDSEGTNRIRQRIRDDRNWGNYIGEMVDGFGDLVAHGTLAILAFVITIPLFSSMPGFRSAWMTAAFFAGVILITLISIWYAQKSQKKAWEGLNSLTDESRVFWHMVDGGISYQNGKDIRIYCAADMIQENGDYLLADRFMGLMNKTAAMFARSAGVSAAVMGIVQGTAYLYVALQALSGNIDIGSVFLYAGSIYQFSGGLSRFLVSAGKFYLASQRMQSTLDYFDIPNAMYKGTIPVEKRRDFRYTVEFHDVSFRYPGHEELALSHLNLKFNIGERMAVVGQNGSGKTTMIKLLCRLYDPTEGYISLNGTDIRKYNYTEYLRLFSVVFQDFKVFAFPLGQNVAACEEYDDARAREALEKSGFGQRFKSMPQGLATCLYKDYAEDGVELSGGEAQKIALARALYKDAPFIILDEPTAALDPVAEYEIYSKFNEIVGRKTAVYISHRLSSCRFCQDIAVFHEGRLVQRGSHEALLQEEGGKYYELWHAQAQYYTDVPAGSPGCV